MMHEARNFHDSIEAEAAELEANGWTRWKGKETVWKSPTGQLFTGPHGAWLRMKQAQRLDWEVQRGRRLS